MKYTIEDFMGRLSEAERRWVAADTTASRSAEAARLEELERENARLRNFAADLLLSRSA